MALAIVGVGESDYSFDDGRPAGQLAVEAIQRALDDAGLAAADVDAFVVESQLTPRTAPVDEIAVALGVGERTFTASSSIVGAGLVAAPLIAEMAIDRGLASVVVTYYASSRASGKRPYAYHAEDVLKAGFEMPVGWYGQPVYFGAIAQRYAYEYGLRPEEIGSVAVSAREFASATPNALRRRPITLDDYLASPYVAEPLRKLDCCLVNDGGVAFVMTDLARARDLAKPPVVAAGAGWATKPVSQSQYFTQSEDLLSTAAAESGRKAFGRAGISPSDVDIAEIYDCFTMSTILQLEDLGFAPKGEGGAFVASGAIGRTGKLPVNTHGGLLSQSFMVGGNHVVEAVRQIRRERGTGQIPDASVAVVTGLGVPEHSTLVLTGDR